MWRRDRLAPNVFRASIEVGQNKDWEAWALLSSDRHWDNPKSDLKMQIRHLDEAQEKGAIIIDNGDLFCAMQGKADDRRSKSNIRPEHNTDTYFDTIVEDAARFFKPYQHNFLCVGVGNHENSIKKRLEIDLTERFLMLMNLGSSVTTYNGHYSGYVFFSFTLGSFKNRPGASRIKTTKTLKYLHGYGGSNKRAQDMAKQATRASDAPDADIILSGHTHQSSMVTLMDERITASGVIYPQKRLLLKAPTYKNEWEKGMSDYHDTQERGPRPLGAWWLRFRWDRSSEDVIVTPIMAE